MIIDVYGMTETCGMLTASPLHVPRPGTVGRALQGIELKIAPDGEVLAKGANVTGPTRRRRRWTRVAAAHR
jgi:long-chain acyl-CoA synthetase